MLRQIQVNIPMLQPHLAALHLEKASCAMTSLCINGQKSGTKRMHKGKDVSIHNKAAGCQCLAENMGASEDLLLSDKSVHLRHFYRS